MRFDALHHLPVFDGREPESAPRPERFRKTGAPGRDPAGGSATTPHPSWGATRVEGAFEGVALGHLPLHFSTHNTRRDSFTRSCEHTFDFANIPLPLRHMPERRRGSQVLDFQKRPFGY